LDTDASNHNVGAVVSQVQDGCKVVVAYYNKTLLAPEKNYWTTRRELLDSTVRGSVDTDKVLTLLVLVSRETAMVRNCPK